MNILMIHPHDLFSKEEPWTVRILNIASQFRSKQHNIKLIYFPLDYKAQASFFSDGIEFIPLSRRVGIRPYLHNIQFLRQLGKWADIIHFQKCFYHAALPALISGFLGKKPVHYDWDDWEIKIFHYSARQPRLVGIFLAAMERFIPNLCDTVSVSSQRLKTECIRYDINEERLFMAPVGADLDLFHPEVSGVRIRERYNLEGPIVVYLGQLHGGQYVEQFIKAAKMVLNKIPDITFMIVGDGYRLAELKKLAEDLDLTQDIIFTGSVAHREIPIYLAASDIAVACFEENDITQCKSPLKIAEYLASGKPIVASDVGEVKRMLGGAGILTIPGNSEDLALGIIKLLEDEPLRKRLSQKARKRAEEIYNWNNTSQNILEAYHFAIEKGRSPANKG